MQLNGCSRVQVISAHSQTAKDHVTLINHRHVARSHLDLGSDGFDNASGFLLEDEAAGLGAQFGVSTVVILMTTGVGVLRVGAMKLPVLPGSVSPLVVPPYFVPYLPRNGMFMDL